MVWEPGYRLSVVAGPDGTVREILEAIGIRGWRDEAMLGRNVGDASAGGVRGASRAAAWQARIEVARRHRTPMRYMDLRPDTPEGGDAVVSTMVTPVYGVAGDLEAILLHAHDLSRELEFEARLKASEERFRGMAEAAPQMVWVADANRKPKYLSRRWEAFTGVPVQTLLDGGLRRVIHPDDHHSLKQAGRAGQQPTTTTVQFRLRAADGSYRWMEVQAEPILAPDGALSQWVGGTTEITDRLAEAAAHVRAQKREALGMLAGGIAHDFNNVMSAILSNAELAQIELTAGSSPDGSIAEIQRGAQRAAELVERMLAFSREGEPKRASVDLGAVVLEACSLVEPTLPASAKLAVQVASGLRPLEGDSTQLHQVVMNLVVNAGQATDRAPRPGTISVVLDEAPPGEHGSMVVADAGGALRLRVRDDGVGIAPDVRERIFDPFFTTRGSGEGTGLGLAAAQTIVHSHGGTIDVISDPGTGATFTVLLPVSGNAPAHAGSEPAADAGAAAPRRPSRQSRLLFVDDEPALTRAIERFLPLRGYAVVVCTDPADALRAFGADPRGFDALITDLAMPGMNGLELIERVRTLRSDLPVVLSSGLITPDDRSWAKHLGVAAIVDKPCSVDDLLAVLPGIRDLE
jgi:PAS domain S-box-containing protein